MTVQFSLSSTLHSQSDFARSHTSKSILRPKHSPDQGQHCARFDSQTTTYPNFQQAVALVIPSANAGNTFQWLSMTRLSLAHCTLTQYRQGQNLSANLCHIIPARWGSVGNCSQLWRRVPLRLDAPGVAWYVAGGGWLLGFAPGVRFVALAPFRSLGAVPYTYKPN